MSNDKKNIAVRNNDRLPDDNKKKSFHIVYCIGEFYVLCVTLLPKNSMILILRFSNFREVKKVSENKKIMHL